MLKLADGIHTWSVFSEEKQLDFNGYHVVVGDNVSLVDPPPLTGPQVDAIRALGVPTQIILTNKDHRRGAVEAAAAFKAKIAIHHLDAGVVDCEVDRMFEDGDTVGGLEVVQIADAKSRGECALYWRDRKVLFVGDSLIGKPPGQLSLLPVPKIADPARATAGVAPLANLDIEMVLVGDGVSILQGGQDALHAFLEKHGS